MWRGSARPAGWIFTALVAVTHVLWCATSASAQGSPGQNAVCTSASGCSSTIGTAAFIDASVLFQNDICTTLYFILNGTNGQYSPGAVIDARGITGAAALTCPANTTPWLKGGVYLNKSSTILLPAGTIVIPSTWNLPSSTHLIGVGSNITSAGFTPGTTLLAQSGFSGSAMMSFCTAACTGIGVENLTLNGQSQAIDGIDNANAQDLTYVDHVGGLAHSLRLKLVSITKTAAPLVAVFDEWAPRTPTGGGPPLSFP
jgi:hypothetical protein